MAKMTVKPSHNNKKTEVSGENTKIHIHEYVLLVFILVLVCCSIMQIVENKKNAENSCVTVVDQLKEMISGNDNTIEELRDTLKDELLIRADVVAERLARNEELDGK